MKLQSGLKPAFRDNRDLDFHQTFGAMVLFPDHYSVDAGRGFPNQHADGNPFECTAYTSADIALDEDNIEYTPPYVYAKTLLLTGAPPTTQGVQIRDALKATRVYGLLPTEHTPKDLVDSPENINADYTRWPVALDLEAAKHRRGKYFNVQPLNGDWFDGIRSAIQMNNLSVSIGTPFYSEWVNVGKSGIISSVPNRKPDSWHCWAVKGWKTIDGAPYLLGKVWLGENYGDNGWAYFSREVINQLWRVHGTQAFTVVKATPEDVFTIKFDLMTTVIAFLYRVLAKLGR